MKKLLSLLMAITLLTALALPAFAAEPPVKGELKLITYNVAGLPIKSLVTEGRGARIDAARIGKQIGAAGVDLLGVQEDFSNYRWLRGAIGAPYYTFNKGNIPAGDGLDFFSRRPLYNPTRVTWAQRYGGITYGAMDEYTPKGFLHAVMELAPGVYVDVYTLHANASKDWSLPYDQTNTAGEHRRAQYRQLSDYIQAHSEGRALIVMGDFNSMLYFRAEGLYDELVAPNGLKDTWADVYNKGKLRNDGKWNLTTLEDGYVWINEYIDKIFYRGSDTVKFSTKSAESKAWTGDDGESLSDHSSWTATLEYTLTGKTECTCAYCRLQLRRPRPMPPREKLWGYVANVLRDLPVLGKDLWNLVSR